MSPKFDLGKILKKDTKQDSAHGFNTTLIMRLVVAAIIFAFALIVKLPALVKTLLLIVSAAAAGYDIVLDAATAIEKKDFFAQELWITLITVMAFAIGFGAEGAALVILYHLGKLAVDYVAARTKQSALELVRFQTKDTVGKVNAIVNEPNAGDTQLALDMEKAASLILKGAMILAVLYAIIVPLVFHVTPTESIHRALCILVVAAPTSVVAAIPSAYIVGICYSAVYGLIFRNANALEKTEEVDTVIFDKDGVLTNSHPRVLSVAPELIDTKTFMNFAAHALYFSEQPIAKGIAEVFDGEYRSELISGFNDIPGKGVELSIANAAVLFGTHELFDEKGITLPEEKSGEGLACYMSISGRYVGRVLFSDETFDYAGELVEDMMNCGIANCALVTSDSAPESAELAAKLGIKRVYSECDAQRRMQLINETSAKASVMYIYSEGLEVHSSALIDARVGEKGKHADIIAAQAHAVNLPAGISIAHRTREIAVENGVFVFSIKAILIFLAMIGWCNIWFAIFIDIAANLAAFLNAIRVTKQSLIEKIKDKA